MLTIKKLLTLSLLASLALAGCTTTTPNVQAVQSFAPADDEIVVPARAVGPPKILAIGDSMMSWNSLAGQSIPQNLAYELGESVTSRAVPGAKIYLPRRTLVGMSIPGQFVNQRWDTVVLNGGGNDIWQSCGCGKCGAVLDRLITADGKRGKIPSLVKYAILPVSDRAVYIGYLRTPGTTSIVESCADEAAELERRIKILARSEPRFHFVSNSQVVPHGSSKFHDVDTVHPSVYGSKIIAARVADVIEKDRR